MRLLAPLCAGCFVVSTLPMFGQSSPPPIEPTAGSWKTWIISSGRDLRVPPPPNAAATQAEVEWLRGFIAQNDNRSTQQIKFWDGGSPAYRWMELIYNRFLDGQPVGESNRILAYVAIAMYDATVAAWEAKYTYNRPRPSEVDATLKTALPVPRSPSYPSEHAAAAAAAAEVLAYMFPSEAETFRSQAEEAGRSRLSAGLQFPSDYSAGFELGKRVAEAVIAKARVDGSGVTWTGTVPTGRCMWVGANPGNVTVANFRPFLLTSPSEFRPPAPPACDSAIVTQQTADVRNIARGPAAFATNERAFYWQGNDGIRIWNYRLADKWMAEDKLDQNPPRAARAYALMAATWFDSFIASNDGKFAYWYIRPHQLDSAIVPLFPVPPFPSYPSNHSTLSAANAEILAYLFPTRAAQARALGKQAGDSRLWAGIHYQIDNESGVTLGQKVAQKFIDWAKSDGSE
jgi:membrane-associated phospholipid phosphatase